MNNSMRNYVKILQEICEEEGIDLKSFSYDWFFCLRKNGMNNFIFGYQFGLNIASVHSICCDKCAASEIMSSLKIPNIEHCFFMSPSTQRYIGAEGNWNILIKKLNKHGQLVCKSNEGTGGNLVFRVCNQYELENAVYKIFNQSRSMAVSPYYEIENEYRAIVLDREIKLLYSKKRPYIMGDGIHSIEYLIHEYLSENSINSIDANLFNEDLTFVLNRGEVFELNWKHNLGQGAKSSIVRNHCVKNSIENIVKLAVDKMNIKFASIDVVQCYGEYKILEINSGVMMEHFSQQDDKTYKIAKEIYKEAILKMFK